ncbi:MAG: sulfite exporter TauE/SafE family protein [Oscillospiraceae bacterium]
MVQILLAVIVTAMAAYGTFVGMDILRNRNAMGLEKGSYLFYAASSAIIMFCGTFGLSDTALSVFAYRKSKYVEDKLIMGTIIAGAILPVGTMAIAFLSSFQVDPVTLIVCIAAQSVGAVIGVRILLGLDEHHIRQAMGAALIGAALLIVFKLFYLGDSTGDTTELRSYKLFAAACSFFVFGAMNLIGLGSTVPNMAILMLLGMDVKSVFPIVMSANIISIIFAGFNIVQHKAYCRKAALGSVLGVLGVLLAVHFVKSVDVAFLQLVMVALLVYCAFSMLHEEYRSKRMALKLK